MASKPPFPTPESWYRHVVSYGETDAMGVVYYAEYLHYFERARSRFTNVHGMSYAVMEEKGLFLPVREAQCRYISPARYDDEIFVHLGIENVGRASLRFCYEVLKSDRQTLLATGFTEHACVNGDGKVVRMPEWLKEICTD